MSDLDYKKIDFLQIEKHVDSAISDLRRIQHAGKYSKKVCTPAMYGANMLNAQKNIISSARHEADRLEQENAELREALHLMVDFAVHQMNPYQNDPSIFDDEDFGNLNHAKKLLNK